MTEAQVKAYQELANYAITCRRQNTELVKELSERNAVPIQEIP